MSNETNTTVTQAIETAELEKPQCKRSEKIGHALGVLGHDSAYTLWSWTTPFLTDLVRIPALALGILLAGARIFDGVNDIAMGVIADRTRTKWGRFRPWLMRAGPLFCLCMMISFIIPSDNMVIRIIYASVMYIAVDVVFTAVDIPFWSLPAAMTSNTKERAGIIGTTTATSNFISGAVGIIMPLALASLGADKASSYFIIALPVGIFAAIMYFCSFKLVREHVVPDDSKKFSLKLALLNIFHNQPLLCVQLSNVFFLFALILRGYLNYYYCQYNLGDVAYMAVLNGIGLVCGIAGSLIFIFFNKFLGKKNCMYTLACLYIAANLVLFFAGWSNIMIVYCCSAISTIAGSGAIVCVNAMMADTMEYGEWKTGQRNEALITSTRCFVTKIVAAGAGIVIAAVIGLTGYVPLVEQSVQTLNSFHIVYSLVTSGTVVLAIIPMFFYKLTEKRHAEIMVELAQRKIESANKNDQ